MNNACLGQKGVAGRNADGIPDPPSVSPTNTALLTHSLPYTHTIHIHPPITPAAAAARPNAPHWIRSPTYLHRYVFLALTQLAQLARSFSIVSSSNPFTSPQPRIRIGRGNPGNQSINQSISEACMHVQMRNLGQRSGDSFQITI